MKYINNSNRNPIWQIVILLFAVNLLISCEKTFEFSPYEVDIDSHKKDINAAQIKKLQKNDDGSSRIVFATISDTHYHYSSLGEIIKGINNDPEIELLIVVGDIADQGLQKEFEIYNDIMEDLNIPYITIIGNHDYKSNGEAVYREMYGPTSFDFMYKNAHFVGFDDVFWENENSIPDFEWLDKITAKYESNTYQIVMAHIPPFGDQFTSNAEDIYKNILNKNNVNLSLNGHTHGFYYGNYYKDSVTYLVNEWPKKPVYNKVIIENNKLQVRKIDL